MLRVRGFTQDDAHSCRTAEQLSGEIARVCRLVHETIETIGFKDRAYLKRGTREQSTMSSRRCAACARRGR